MLLRAAGHKVTPQRMLILSYTRHASGHVTAAQIIGDIRASYPYLDTSTVYRTLAAAKAIGLVSETRIGGTESVFEWIGERPHHHLVCRKCGSMTSVDDRYLSMLANTLKTETGFEADLGHLAIFGICKNCATAS
jgi:Fur family ferric uptake transcriptional regulator